MGALGTPAQAVPTEWTCVDTYAFQGPCLDPGQQYQGEGWSYRCPPAVATSGCDLSLDA